MTTCCFAGLDIADRATILNPTITQNPPNTTIFSWGDFLLAPGSHGAYLMVRMIATITILLAANFLAALLCGEARWLLFSGCVLTGHALACLLMCIYFGSPEKRRPD